jgi:hypothetical protein
MGRIYPFAGHRVVHLSIILASFILRIFLASYSGVLENLGKAFKLSYAKPHKMYSVTGEGIAQEAWQIPENKSGGRRLTGSSFGGHFTRTVNPGKRSAVGRTEEGRANPKLCGLPFPPLQADSIRLRFWEEQGLLWAPV